MAVVLAAIVSGLYGTVVRSPVTPICRAGVPCSAPAAHVRLTFMRNGVAVRSVVTTSTGAYRVTLAPGLYRVVLPRSMRLARPEPRLVTVTRGASRRLILTIDTGIR
jgi:hypothetical protein